MGVIVVALLINGLGPSQAPATTTTAASATRTTPTAAPQYVRIRVEARSHDSVWVRSSLTDLPEYSVSVSYIVHNDGNVPANSTRIVVGTDNSVTEDYVVSIPPNGYHNATVVYSYEYDTAHEVIVEASSGQSSDKASVPIDAKLPRLLIQPSTAPSSEMLSLSKLFVTPNDSEVGKALNEIWHSWPLSSHCPWGPGPKCPQWYILSAIQHWVSVNVEYSSQDNYAQLPRETLQLKSGDSQDSAILVVSLLRAAGWNEREAFVVLGSDGKTCYGWVRAYAEGAFPIPWQNLMPLKSGFTSCYYDISVCWRTYRYGNYVPVYYFNDVQIMFELPR
jgi:hypothetical protein